MIRVLIPVSILLATASELALSQFVPTPKGFTNATGYAGVPVRYKQVPTGICELDPKVKSYAGYADVADDQHIFWWFFEARNVNPSDAPLSVWINGGPGASSMIGLWQENGPCGVDYDGNLYSNPYSWTNVSNMLFVDQPTDTGFSYSYPVPGYMDPTTGYIMTLPNNSCPDYAAQFGCATYSYANTSLTANSSDAAAPNFWKTVQGFMGAFPQYSRNEFIFTTESYGGHYGPIFNEYFLTQNAKNIPGAHKINLAAVMIGNGWYDPYVQYEAYYNYTVYPGNTYDFKPFNKTIEDLMYNNLFGAGNCLDMVRDCNERGINEVCSYGDSFCANLVEALYDNYANRDEYDMRELLPDPFPYSFYESYLNTPAVQDAIGAYVNFSSFSPTVGGNNPVAIGGTFGATGDDSRLLNTVPDMLKLIQANLTVIMYTGDADYNCNWLGGEVVSNNIGAPNFDQAGYVNITTSDGIVHGQVRQAGKFAFVRVYDSGHEVPFYQPVLALEMFERVIKGLDIATGTQAVKSGYLTNGTPKSTYREGNSTIQMKVVSPSRTYNTTTNEPNPPHAPHVVRWKRDIPYLNGKRLS